MPAQRVSGNIPTPRSSKLTFCPSSNTPVLVDFWATWCGPCKMVAPVLAEIAATRRPPGQLTVAKLDVDANPETARNFDVVSIPTLILFKDGEPVKRIVGAKGKAALLRELSDAVSQTSRNIELARARRHGLQLAPEFSGKPKLCLRQYRLGPGLVCNAIGSGFPTTGCTGGPWNVETASRRRRSAAPW